jgi:uncharacterized protein YdhG (YjbR/CyaY superfamily)
MSFKAYLDNIEIKTGKTPDDFRKLAEKKGLLKDGTKAMEIVSWLKKDFALGHGHAMAIYAVFKGIKSPENTAQKATKKPKIKASSMKAAKNIDEYLATQPPKTREVLEKLRRIILSIAPEAEEVISYAMPAFKYHGMLVGFAGWKNHAGFYPWNSRTIAEFKDELKAYETSKGAIQFPLEKPIPVALVKKIVKARMKDNLAKEKLKKQSK